MNPCDTQAHRQERVMFEYEIKVKTFVIILNYKFAFFKQWSTVKTELPNCSASVELVLLAKKLKVSFAITIANATHL